MGRNFKADRELKIKFLQEQYPDIKKMDFYGNIYLLWEAKEKLFKAGFYKTKHKTSILDAAVLKLVSDAQGIKAYKQISTVRTRGRFA